MKQLVIVSIVIALFFILLAKPEIITTIKDYISNIKSIIDFISFWN